jgi:hypothetical protein
MSSTLIKKVVYFTLLVTVVLVMTLVFPSSKILAESNEVIPIESFETGTFNGGNYKPVSGVITNDPNKVVSGLYWTVVHYYYDASGNLIRKNL